MFFLSVFLGGVALSDKIGNTNATVVNRLCRSDGVLLRPERPATAMDSTFLGTGGPLGEVWHTYASDAEQHFFVEYVMVTNLTEPYGFFWKELFDTEDADQPERVISDIYIAFDLQHPLDYYWLTSTNSSPGILLPSCAQNATTFYSPFHLFVFVPYSTSSHWVLFGELSKQLPITKQRFEQIHPGASAGPSDSFEVRVTGVSGEQVSVTIGYIEQALGKIDLQTVQCSFSSAQDLSTLLIVCNTNSGCHCNPP